MFGRPVDAAVARLVGGDVIGRGTIVGEQDGLLTVAIGPIRLEAPAGDRASPTSGATVVVMIRPEEVALTQPLHGSPPTSARNAVQGRVTDVEPLGALCESISTAASLSAPS